MVNTRFAQGQDYQRAMCGTCDNLVACTILSWQCQHRTAHRISMFVVQEKAPQQLRALSQQRDCVRSRSVFGNAGSYAHPLFFITACLPLDL